MSGNEDLKGALNVKRTLKNVQDTLLNLAGSSFFRDERQRIERGDDICQGERTSIERSSPKRPHPDLHDLIETAASCVGESIDESNKTIGENTPIE